MPGWKHGGAGSNLSSYRGGVRQSNLATLFEPDTAAGVRWADELRPVKRPAYLYRHGGKFAILRRVFGADGVFAGRGNL